MLARSDRYGRVYTSIPGLAKLAGVSVSSARKAISLFLDPDPDSRTKDHEGRRVCEIDGGYGLLNHDKYRELKDEEERKAYKAAWIAEKRAKDKGGVVDSDVTNVDKCRHQSTHTDTDTDTYADADAEADKPKPRFVLPAEVSPDVWAEFEQHRKEIRKPLKDLSRTKSANILMALSIEQQQACVDKSIASGWAGLFPDKADKKKSGLEDWLNKSDSIDGECKHVN